ncbi:peroxiredoxin family protein [Falsibacillus pallidus]|uniref:DsbE subfamily thiol:disulfide oxidoreductase n=1 Tax=Falsibacillus pallidus TaxID=493781 RepID=A0A370GF20_9BACI|nr:TlpA disulfide reductase family protein [Falsibacillus pallidus]RDI41004.1 DsbE subfamily thiol:disulfide oxidoreductase [Falsibacillus pallidus]
MNQRLFSMIVMVLLLGIAIILVLNTYKDRANDEPSTPVQEASPSSELQSSGLGKGDVAPDFTLKTLEGKEKSLSDFRGKKVILNFWATWCPPCKAEIPHMVKFYGENAKSSNVEIVAVNLTAQDKGEETIRNFVKEYKMPFPVLLDSAGDIGSKYGAFAIPTSYIIDSKGVIREKIVGPMNEEMMSDLLKNIE